MITFLKKLFRHECQTCVELRRQNVYLQTLVDHVLASRGIAPIGASGVSAEKDEPDEIEKLRADGATIFGGME